MNTHCYLNAFTHYVPEKILSNKDLETFMETNDEWITVRTGIRKRRILAADEENSTMAHMASQKALEAAGISAAEISHILVGTCTPDSLCPSVAARVAGTLGCTHAMPLDFNAACSGFVYGLEMAHALTLMRPNARILLLGSEALSRRMNYQERTTSILFGDASGATIISAQPLPNATHRAKLIDVSCDSDGTYCDLIRVGGGTAMQVKVGDPVPESYFAQMEGREVFKQAVRTMASESHKMLEKHGLTIQDVDLFVPHQANLRIIEAVAQRMGLAEEKVLCNVADYGNTSAASIPLALSCAMEQGKIQPGMKVLISAIGSGLTWGTALLEFETKGKA